MTLEECIIKTVTYIIAFMCFGGICIFLFAIAVMLLDGVIAFLKVCLHYIGWVFKGWFR